MECLLKLSIDCKSDFIETRDRGFKYGTRGERWRVEEEDDDDGGNGTGKAAVVDDIPLVVV